MLQSATADVKWQLWPVAGGRKGDISRGASRQY